MWSKNKKLTLLLILSGILVLLIAGTFFVTGWLLPFNSAKNTMDPGGILTVQALDDGTLQAQWPAGENAEHYRIEILDADGTMLHAAETAACVSSLPELPADRELKVKIISARSYGKHVRTGSDALEATVTLTVPQIRDLSWQADPEQSMVDVSFDMSEGELCRVYMTKNDAEPALIGQLQNGELQMRFGENETYPVPAHGEKLHIAFLLERSAGNVTYLGKTERVLLTREDFLDKTLNVECTDNGENSYTLTWNETKGEHYEVLLSSADGEIWKTLATVPCDQERVYNTGHLDAYSDYIFRVVAVGGQTLPGSEFAAMSEPVQLHTGAKLMYSTIWPLMDQKVYADPEATQELGTVAAGSAWCALGLEGQYLKIRFDGQDGYIDSDYCMINLPEYVGDLCLYNITNSFSSIYTVHEYGIKNVSGTVVKGYENVRISEGRYLAPLLFPTAQKLIAAGEAAKEAGYTLKIYDSFRPKSATDSIYGLTNKILNNKVPSYTYTGKVVKDLYKLDWDPYENEDATVETTPEGETVEPDRLTEPKPLTFRILMTNNGEYSLGQFLAPGISRHNFGVALDLTIVDTEGKELSMQTSMHDLSWYSAFKRNNANANTLYKIMSGAGLQNISSEWWHYQDNAVYETHKYTPLREGVSFACWVKDDNGWRYRLEDGSFYTDCTQTIEGREYIFDQNGYISHG